jgi:ABC-2 type transport system ATP-binding protein
MPSARALEVVGLRKSYEGRPAVQDLSLYVDPGEIVGLVGPNGAGKSTTLKAVAGLVAKDGGTIRVAGRDVDLEPEGYKAYLGYIPETASLPDYLTPDEFLGYVARLRGVPPGEVWARLQEVAEALVVPLEEDKLLSEYSRGMKQRVAIASSFLHRPALLVWDEPLVGIDPAGQARVKAVLRGYIAAGGAALISTHLLDSAERLCHRMVVLHQGRAVAEGDMSALRGAVALGQNSTLEEVFLRLTQESSGAAEVTGEGGRRVP